MQLNLLSVLATLGFANVGLGYVVTVFANADCTGTARSINVYDNSCRAPITPGFQGYTITTYGGAHQRAYIFAPGNCGDLTSAQAYWADGGSDKFRIGNCISGGVGHVYNAMASYSSGFIKE